ncbi:restriction endonuclease [Actinomadura sp. NAK00032]|uniref:McrC family protein n=1 Tax=Actinomadura sp. NAK00032 TaxID=2742128 RepID=UPI0015911FB8|nr:restriction endonuclease [Actinomadura sp. NAK00032]QKW32871.1 restriction endonuclease [Actinomadura sp. NAK00032]
MTDIALTEHGAALSLPLSEALGRAVAASRVVEAAPDPDAPGRWRLKAAGKVGVAAVTTPGGETLTIRVTPKVPIRRLLFLLGYALDAKGWRDEEVSLDAEPELLPALAHLFEQQADRALRQGLLQGYRTTEETSLVMRGRLREADQLRRHHGEFPALELVHDEYTTDIAENRLVRTATDRLLRLPGVSRDLRGRLLRLRVRLADVTPIGRGHEPPVWRPTRLNVRYQPAVRLAELVLQGISVEHRAGDITVSGFLLDMARVFEDFVTVALREALKAGGGYSVLQASHYLDEGHAIRIVPDFVHCTDDGTPHAVADAKYKSERPDGFPDADLYQMLAYCTALHLPDGHLIYAKGNAPHATHRVRKTGITIHQHTLDLDKPPATLLADAQTLAERLLPRTSLHGAEPAPHPF